MSGQYDVRQNLLSTEVAEALAAPFADGEVNFKPQAISGNRALAVAFIDARTVMRRLDSAAGPGSWEFDWEPVASPDNRVAVKGRLTVLGLTRCDAGEASREEEPLKSAVSDALKRCAVHFGIGRSLYDTPPQWFGYDQGQRRWTEQPRLPGAGPAPTVTTRQGAQVRPDTGEVVIEAPAVEHLALRKSCSRMWRDLGNGENAGEYVAALKAVSGEEHHSLKEFSLAAWTEFRDHLRDELAEIAGEKGEEAA